MGIEKKTYSYPVLLSAGVLTFGACMSIPYDSPKVTLLGSVLALWSTCMSGLRPVLTALLLKNSKESGLTPVPLLWYDAAFSTIFLFFAYLMGDETLTVAGYFKDYGYGRGVSILVGGSFMAFAYNIVVFYLVKVTSSLTSVVLANLKTTLIIVVAVVLWDKSISWVSVMGFVIFFASLFAYSYLSYTARGRAARQSSAATAPAAKEAEKAPSKETTRLVGS